MNDNIKWLTTVPASDGNFVSHLKSARKNGGMTYEQSNFNGEID